MKKGFYVIAVLLITLFMMSCSHGKNKVNYDTTTPENIIKSYFLALNNKDKKFISSVTDKDSHGFDCKDIWSIKLISIKENPKATENYNKYINIDHTKYYDVKVYDVIFNLKMKLGRDFTDSNGKNAKNVLITKDNENSNWVIREIGEG